jgi:WD40 repeat protein
VLTLIQAGVPCEWVHDSQRFLLEFFDTIHNSPSQIYHYALPFSPSTSWLYKSYTVEFSQEAKVVKGLPAGWGTCSRTVELGYPCALACWEDTVAVGLGSGGIFLLDSITGGQVAVLSGHADGRVISLAFLPDGTSLVSGSTDNTLKHWDIQTGGVVKTFHGHNNWVSSTSISSDCITIASGSSDKTIRLWNIWTGECHHIIEQQKGVDCVSFSPTNPQRFISVSGGIVQQWDISGHQIEPTYQGSHATFSLDGTHIVSCEEKAAMVWNSNSGAIIAKCLPDGNSSGGESDRDFKMCCPSPDGGLVAITAGTTVHVWDITSSNQAHLVGHTNKITAIIFSSSSLISASNDGSVKFWQIGSLSTDPVATSTTSTLPTSSIQSTTLQAKDSIAISSDSAGMVKIWDLSTGLCKGSFQTPAKGNTTRDAQVVDGKLILAWHKRSGKEIYIWDIERGEPLQTMEVQSGVWDLRISGDGSKLFCLDGELIRAWSMQTGEAVGKILKDGVMCLDPLHVDGSKIWACLMGSLVQGWDFGVSGSPPVPLSNTPSERPYLHFTNGSRSGGPDKIEDTVTGKEVFQLSGRYVEPTATQWDGRYLITGYDSGEVVILDFDHLHV